MSRGVSGLVMRWIAWRRPRAQRMEFGSANSQCTGFSLEVHKHNMDVMMKHNTAAIRCHCPTTARLAPPFLLRPVQLSRRECFVSKRFWSAQILRHERQKLSVSASASAGTKFVAPAIQGSTTGEVYLTGDHFTVAVGRKAFRL